MKRSIITCMRFDERNIHVAVVNSISGEIIKSDVLTPDFEVLEPSGMIASPARLGAFIQESVAPLNLASPVKVSIGLKYLELKRLNLPNMPETELIQIVRDEAVRESVFSYAGDPVAVSHMVIGSSKDGASLAILAVVLPQEIIDRLIDVFKNTSLKLISVQPSLIGLGQIIDQYSPVSDGPYPILSVNKADAELYVWEKSAPLFWRYLSAGSEDPENLENEILASLDHYSSRSPGSKPVEKILLVGEKTRLDLGPTVNLEFLPVQPEADLLGLGLSRKSAQNLQFISSSSGLDRSFSGNLWLSLTLGLFLMVNLLIGWQLAIGAHRVALIQRKSAEEAQLLAVKNNQLARLKKTVPVPPGSSMGFDSTSLLAQLRGIVPGNMRFDSISLDYSTGSLVITGICLDPADLDRFLQRLYTVERIRSADLVSSDREDRSGLTAYHFKINLVMEVTYREQPQ